MSDNSKTSKGIAQDQQTRASDTALSPPGATMKILGQYVKDLSFENPNAPTSLTINNPEISVAVNVGANPVNGPDYEVILKFTVNAAKDSKAVFACDLSYAGIFRLEGVPDNLLQAVLLVEGPRLLFPFARQVLADATRDGGFPPVMLDPIDFSQLFHKRNETEVA